MKKRQEEEEDDKGKRERPRSPSLSTYSSSSPPLPLHSFAFGLAAARMLCVFSATAMDPCIFSFRVRNIVCGEAPPTNFAKSASAMTSVTSGLSSGEPLVTFFSLPGRSSRDHFVPSMSKTMRPYDFSLRWRWRRWKKSRSSFSRSLFHLGSLSLSLSPSLGSDVERMVACVRLQPDKQ